VSGGHSPIGLFKELRVQPLDWSRVHIGLVDERWVSQTEPGSNEKMVRESLLRDGASLARFYGMKNAAATPALGAAAAWDAMVTLPRPFDLIVLGMGDDGHTASLFPGSPNLRTALDLAAPEGCIGMSSPIAPHARLSLNLRAILDSRRIIIHILGEDKLRTHAAACDPGLVEAMPVRAGLRQPAVPVQVAWAP
jgi:6-phosphogluconolactonase